MKNQKAFGALRATTLAALCAGGLVLMTACASDGAEKGCGEDSCGKSAEKAGAEKTCSAEKGCSGDKSGAEKTCSAEKGCSGEKSSSEKTCG